MRLLAAILLLATATAHADPWVYEFEFDFSTPRFVDRLLAEGCGKVVNVNLVSAYAVDPRPGWEVSCGNNRPFYNHFLGRDCFKPLPRLVIECGWRHFSSPADGNEITYDAFAVRGRFEFKLGGRR